ncbi:MAG: Arginase [Anaerolineae bacterium]|nr:Arginase [Anaerolineae bacterium]
MGLTSLLGIPIDCSGRLVGVERMPATLRAAGLAARLGLPDGGDLPVSLTDPHRDPVTGIIAFEQVCAVSEVIRQAVASLLTAGERPLLMGGCCTLLIGVAAALDDDVSLVFVDGHLDFYDGRSSPTGETADMELAILTGLGPAGLVDLGGPPPLLEPARITVLGFRDEAQAAADGAPDPRRLAPAMRLLDVAALRQQGLAASGAAVANRLAQSRFWLHLDLDVLDPSALPAVDYLQPGGLSWAELTALVTPLAQSPALSGADVTIYNPTLDLTGRYAHQIVDWLGHLFAD